MVTPQVRSFLGPKSRSGVIAAGVMGAVFEAPSELTCNRRHCAGCFAVDRADGQHQRYRTIVPTISI